MVRAPSSAVRWLCGQWDITYLGIRGVQLSRQTARVAKQPTIHCLLCHCNNGAGITPNAKEGLRFSGPGCCWSHVFLAIKMIGKEPTLQQDTENLKLKNLKNWKG